ncbi:Bgr_08870 family protein [Bartonella sp. WD16.2]|uniref:Bgr_08870 family protein n=1 Tax=Bartonella sp. WD16.2 TaxID=1933904 RepID=UPI00099998BF|nr:Bgr_08870 family protein [Bartonella sp. WD16.2]AQX19646.1 Phage tail repeat like [Bartonella sp. WD16.2]
MAKTEKLAMELPKEGRFISTEFPITREDLIIIDQAVSDLDEKADGKAPSQHTHVISEVSELEDVLSGKMAADKTFALVDLTDVEGANDATETHVLYKSGEDRFAFDSIKSLLGEHQHDVKDITDLEEYIATVNVDLKNYGCLSGKNEWEDTNVFKGKVSIEEGIELTEASSLTLKQEDNVVTQLSVTESLLKGPLKVDDESVYTKLQLDEAMSKEIEKLKRSLPDKSTSLIDKLIDWPELADAELLITQSGKIQWPDWVTDKTKVEIQAWGGGGGGGGAQNDNYLGGGGGGSGCMVWYGYKLSLNGHHDIVIGKGGAQVSGKIHGKNGGYTIIGNNFIVVAGGNGGDDSSLGGKGSRGGNYGLVTDENPGPVRGCNGYNGGDGKYKQISGFGGDAGNAIKGATGEQGAGAYTSGAGGAGYGGGGAGAHGVKGVGGKGANGAVLIRLWKN